MDKVAEEIKQKNDYYAHFVPKWKQIIKEKGSDENFA